VQFHNLKACIQNTICVQKPHFISTGLQPGVGLLQAEQPFQRLWAITKATEAAGEAVAAMSPG
jgi:hypothetical protein